MITPIFFTALLLLSASFTPEVHVFTQGLNVGHLTTSWEHLFIRVQLAEQHLKLAANVVFLFLAWRFFSTLIFWMDRVFCSSVLPPLPEALDSDSVCSTGCSGENSKCVDCVTNPPNGGDNSDSDSDSDGNGDNDGDGNGDNDSDSDSE